MTLSVIIVSYNTKDLTLKCLHSLTLQPLNSLTLEIIVVDNASTDGSVPAIKQHYPRVRVIEAGANVGFAKANNLGVKAASGEYVLLLNSDTEILNGSLSQFVNSALATQASIATCRLVNSDGSLQPQGGALPNLGNVALWMLNADGLVPFNRYQQRSPAYFASDRCPGWVGGTAMLVRKSVYEALGGLDENLFMYAEDVDFCLRAARHGHRVWYFAAPQILHVGQGSGTSEKARLGEFQGLRYLWQKHFPPWQLQILNALLKTGALLRWRIFDMIGKHQEARVYEKAFRLVG